MLIVPGGGKTGTQLNPALVSFPSSDLLAVEGLEKPVAPIYPVAVYSHEEGDSIGSGFVEDIAARRCRRWSGNTFSRI